MTILQELKNRRGEKKHDEQKERAVKLFLQQRKAIHGIADTAGFEEILNFLERGIDICENTLDNVEGGSFLRVKGERDSYRKLQQFLKKLARPEESVD